MSTLMVHFTPALDVLNATSLHCKTPSYRVRLKFRLDHRERFHIRDSWPQSYEQVVGLPSSRKESRVIPRISVVLPRNFGELFGDAVRRREKEFRSWCVSAKTVHPLSELQTAENLRAELEALQQEAEQVRSKANSARLRFMRLTHVVEQLRQRAAMDVRTGREDSARGLLLEKQKVMKALEAARQRAELLEQLAGKLNVAISMKETLLIAALSSPPSSIRSEGAAASDTAVHHVSPRTEVWNEDLTQSEVDEHDISSRAEINSDKDLNYSK